MKYIRAIIYLDENIHKALKMRASMLKTSISNLANNAIKESIEEDAMDLKAIQDRKNEKETPLNIFLKEIKQERKRKGKKINWVNDPLTKAIGKMHLGVSNASVKHDQYLYGHEKTS